MNSAQNIKKCTHYTQNTGTPVVLLPLSASRSLPRFVVAAVLISVTNNGQNQSSYFEFMT